jgi:hypothetical protein
VEAFRNTTKREGRLVGSTEQLLMRALARRPKGACGL